MNASARRHCEPHGGPRELGSEPDTGSRTCLVDQERTRDDRSGGRAHADRRRRRLRERGGGQSCLQFAHPGAPRGARQGAPRRQVRQEEVQGEGCRR